MEREKVAEYIQIFVGVYLIVASSTFFSKWIEGSEVSLTDSLFILTLITTLTGVYFLMRVAEKYTE